MRKLACLNSGAVKESPARVRIASINGPGACGIDYPLQGLGAAAKRAARLQRRGDDARLARSRTRRDSRCRSAGQSRSRVRVHKPGRSSRTHCRRCNRPQSALWRAAGTNCRRRRHRTYTNRSTAGQPYRTAAYGAQPGDADVDFAHPACPQPIEQRCRAAAPARPVLPAELFAASAIAGGRRTGPAARAAARSDGHASAGPVEVKPAATLACPIVSALDQWIDSAVQPAAMHWFRQPVVEIKQISAYSCRGMNGNPNAHISEHAFGNALDVAEFTLADGHKV